MAVVVTPNSRRPAMRERPIIFSGAMVRAILEGRKTQTRRVVKWPVLSDSDGAKRRIFLEANAAEVSELLAARHPHPNRRPVCPFGRPGDRLWVRETWHPAGRLGTEYLIEYKADESERTVDAGFEGPTPAIDAAIARNAWRSPIHMPRWASRLTLEVTGVRVERLHDITPDDARAEGLAHRPGHFGTMYDCGPLPLGGYGESNDPREAYMYLWDSLNAKRGHSWASNPWVWVVTFRRLEEARS